MTLFVQLLIKVVFCHFQFIALRVCLLLYSILLLLLLCKATHFRFQVVFDTANTQTYLHHFEERLERFGLQRGHNHLPSGIAWGGTGEAVCGCTKPH